MILLWKKLNDFDEYIKEEDEYFCKATMFCHFESQYQWQPSKWCVHPVMTGRSSCCFLSGVQQLWWGNNDQNSIKELPGLPKSWNVKFHWQQIKPSLVHITFRFTQIKSLHPQQPVDWKMWHNCSRMLKIKLIRTFETFLTQCISICFQ